MKFTKPKVEAAKNSKTLSQKGKFKSKEGASNGNSQKPSKNALNLMKKDSLPGEICTVIKGSNVKGKISQINMKGKAGKKGESVPAKLSAQVQLGLKLDAMLQQNSDKTGASPHPVSSPSNSNKINRRKKKNPAASGTTHPPVASPPPVNKKPASLSGRSKPTALSPVKKPVVSKKKRPVDNSKPDSPDSNVGGKKNKTAGQMKKVTSDDKTAPSDSDFTLNPSDVLGAAKGVLDLLKKSLGKQKRLHDQVEPIFLSLIFYQPHVQQKVIRFTLAHSLVTEMSDICLICMDVEKKDAEKSKSVWTERLHKENCDRISEVIPLRSLASDYTQYEDKRKLSDRFDHFLVDARISHRVYALLGVKHFHSKRKSPTPVDLKTAMKEHIDRALMKTVAQYKAGGETFSIQVGHSGMDGKQIQENILQVWQQYPQVFGVYWENIRRLSLLTPHTPELPVFASVKPPTNLRVSNAMVWRKSANKPVVGELSTSPDKKVAVYPSGKILVKGMNKENGDDASTKKGSRTAKRKERTRTKLVGKGAHDDDLGGREDMMDSDLDDAVFTGTDLDLQEQPSGKNVKNKRDGKVDKKSKSKMQKTEEDEEEEEEEEGDSDGSGGVDRFERLYLKQLSTTTHNKNNKAMKKDGNVKGKGATGAAVESESDDESEDDDVEMDSSALGIASSSDEEIMDSSDEEEEVTEQRTAAAGKKLNQQQQQKSSGKKKVGSKGRASPQTPVKSNSDDDEAMDCSDDDEEQAVRGRRMGQRQRNQNPHQQGKKNARSMKQSGQSQQSGKGQRNGNNKPGAKKNQQGGRRQPNSSSSSPTHSPSQPGFKKNKKKNNSFQGIKADEVKKRQPKKKVTNNQVKRTTATKKQ